MKLSILIPSRGEIFLQKTIDGILKTAESDFEIIVFLDGYWPIPALTEDKRVHIIHSSVPVGMRGAINSCVRIARGEYLLKCDAHCAFDQGFDRKLLFDMQDDCVMVPRRYSLDVENWTFENNGKIRDAHYLSHPEAFKDEWLGFGLHIKDWFDRGEKRGEVKIDEDMTSQGSCWMMRRNLFVPLSSQGYGTFIQEMQEIGLRVWLSGGKILVNKNTWYAHLWKGKRFGRMYPLDRQESLNGQIYAADYWLNNRFPGASHSFEWLLDRFWPVPTWTEKDISKVIFPKVSIVKPEIQPEPEEAVEVRSPQVLNRNQTVDYINKKFGIDKIEGLPIALHFNRSQYGFLFNELGFRVGAEIGVFSGEYSECLMRANPGVKHFCIDPWLAYPEYVNHRVQAGLCSAEEEAHQRLDSLGAEFIKKFSMDAVKDFPDNSLDYVYIDGNHDFQNVTNDIVEWEKKVRPGGIVAGHDYDLHRFKSRCHVKQVVDGYTLATGVYPWYIMNDECKTRDTHGNSCTSFFWVKA